MPHVYVDINEVTLKLLGESIVKIHGASKLDSKKAWRDALDKLGALIA